MGKRETPQSRLIKVHAGRRVGKESVAKAQFEYRIAELRADLDKLDEVIQRKDRVIRNLSDEVGALRKENTEIQRQAKEKFPEVVREQMEEDNEIIQNMIEECQTIYPDKPGVYLLHSNMRLTQRDRDRVKGFIDEHIKPVLPESVWMVWEPPFSKIEPLCAKAMKAHGWIRDPDWEDPDHNLDEDPPPEESIRNGEPDLGDEHEEAQRPSS